MGKREGVVDSSYIHMGDNPQIPTCSIMGVNIAAVNMDQTMEYITKHLRQLQGKYICVSNVHTTVTSYENEEYLAVQNEAALALPDGKPLSVVCKMRGLEGAARVTGPDLMERIFMISRASGFRHFFYGSTEETLALLKDRLLERYGDIGIVGMYSPPFRQLTQDEDEEIVRLINSREPDFIWVGLGAPKQEIWMAKHKGLFRGVMIGVGAGFNYHAGQIKRAPEWMQRCSLEWAYRLLQDPKRLFKRYLKTNMKFIWEAVVLGK